MDLGNQANWALVLSGTKKIRIVHQDAGSISYIPLPEIKAALSSSVVKVSLRSESAKPSWFLGAWANFYCFAHTGFTLLSQGQRICRLNDDNLFIFDQPTEQIPYSIALQFPKYLEDVTFEIWEYTDNSGRYSPSILVQELAEAIEGTEITLKNVVWEPQDSGLIISTFTEFVPYTRYTVGRFAVISSGEIISEPKITVLAKLLVMQFTSNQRILPSTLKVKITPSK
jgi:hypothetical protein